jgi:hypothetical protein
MVHQWLLQLLAIGWVLVPAAASAQAAETRTAGAQSPDLAGVVERLISRTHAFRQQEGRPPVAPNPQLTAAATTLPPSWLVPASSATLPTARRQRSGRRRTAMTRASSPKTLRISTTRADSQPRLWPRDSPRAGNTRPAIGRTSARTHQQCRPPEVTFQWPGTTEKKTVHPNHGERYTIVRGDAGDFRVEQG